MKKEEIEPNVIYYSTNYDVLAEVIKKLDEVRKNDILKEEFVLRLGKYLINKTGMVLVSFDEEKKLTGCQVISRHLDNMGEYLWIDFAWISPGCPGLREKFFNEIIENCRMRGIKRIQARMNKGYKAMEKLFGTYEIARILEKKVI